MRQFIKIISLASIVLISSSALAQRPGLYVKQTGTSKSKTRATITALNTTENGEGRDYQISGSVSYNVNGTNYTRTFSNVEIGGLSTTELTNEDNDDLYYPAASISKPLDSEVTTLSVGIYERTWLTDHYVGGLVTKRLK